jgi:hypothetical protein
MRKFIAALALSALAAAAGAQIIDGTAEALYGAPRAIQAAGTQFGNSNIGQLGWANGSELDAAFGRISGGNLYLTLTGNLETNFNKIEIFIDSVAGGQNRLRGDNPNVDFNGLNRMGDDGSGNGLTFDAGFGADYYITATNGDIGGGTYQLFSNYAELTVGGAGIFLGGASHTPAQIIGPNGIVLSMNNSNTLGVGSFGNPNDSDPATVLTGLELMIPLSVIGNPGGPIRVTAFINGGGHDFASNQFLGSLPSDYGNLGEPRNINLENIPGLQYFVVPEPASLVALLLAFGMIRRR